MTRSRCAPMVLAVAAMTLSCADAAPPSTVEVPAASGSAHPFVAATGDGFLVSWTEPEGDGHALRYATLHESGDWSEVRTAANGGDWFVNWADFPSVVPIGDGGLAAHWLQRSGPGTYAYDVMISTAADGETWSAPTRPHGDGTQTEHGFVSMFEHRGTLGAVWLDGRRYEDMPEQPATNEMSLRFAALGGTLNGTDPVAEQLLDARVCDCCQTGAALTSAGPIVVYRDRTEEEIRDIAYTRLVDGVWTEPRPIHEDGWHITGCPVNGPQVAANGDRVAVAWYTQADDTARVHLAMSDDAGATFDPPIRIDEGAPLGRVDVLMLDDGRVFVTWLERSGEEAAIRGRIVDGSGSPGESMDIAPMTAQRAGGFPRMAAHGETVLLTWTEPGEQSVIRALRIDLGS